MAEMERSQHQLTDLQQEIRNAVKDHTRPKVAGPPSSFLSGFARVFLFPLYVRWWAREGATTTRLILAEIVYVAHAVNLLLYVWLPPRSCVAWLNDAIDPGFLVYRPVVILALCAFGHGWILVTSHSSETCTAVEAGLDSDDGAASSASEVDSEADEPSEPQQPQNVRQTPVSALRTNCRTWPSGTRPGTAAPLKTYLTTEQLRRLLIAKVKVAQDLQTSRRHVAKLIALVISSGSLVVMKARPSFWISSAISDGGVLTYAAECATSLPFEPPGCLQLICLHTVSLLATYAAVYPICEQLVEAERVYSARWLYAKFFNGLTSSTRAARLGLPQFTLKNVVNVRVWLSLRAGRGWLKQHEAQRRADAVVAALFTSNLVFIGALVTVAFDHAERPQLYLELGMWNLVMSGCMLYFLVLGSRINIRYTKNRSVLLTEQLNVQLRLLQCCEAAHSLTGIDHAKNKAKQEQLQASIKVLELALKLLSEHESSNKVQLAGLPINQKLYRTVQLIVLSVVSTVVGNMLGISLKFTKLIKS